MFKLVLLIITPIVTSEHVHPNNAALMNYHLDLSSIDLTADAHDSVVGLSPFQAFQVSE